MDLDKVILFYGFAPIADTDAVKLWQKTLCESLGIKGRIIVSPHGINGTLGGKMEDLKKYVKATKAYPGFKKIDFKWSDGTGQDFPKLKIKIRPELVAFGNNRVKTCLQWLYPTFRSKIFSRASCCLSWSKAWL